MIWWAIAEDNPLHLRIFCSSTRAQPSSKSREMCLRSRKRIFLDFMITQRGIEANLDKCEPMLSMTTSSNLKEPLRLNGRLAALSIFLPKLSEKAKPFFRLLKGVTKFEWNEK